MSRPFRAQTQCRARGTLQRHSRMLCVRQRPCMPCSAPGTADTSCPGRRWREALPSLVQCSSPTTPRHEVSQPARPSSPASALLRLAPTCLPLSPPASSSKAPRHAAPVLRAEVTCLLVVAVARWETCSAGGQAAALRTTAPTAAYGSCSRLRRKPPSPASPHLKRHLCVWSTKPTQRAGAAPVRLCLPTEHS